MKLKKAGGHIAVYAARNELKKSPFTGHYPNHLKNFNKIEKYLLLNVKQLNFHYTQNLTVVVDGGYSAMIIFGIMMKLKHGQVGIIIIRITQIQHILQV